MKQQVARLGVPALLLLSCLYVPATAQVADQDGEFGPVVTSYLGYLKNEQGVVDDRVSRHEVTASYYRRNSNRIRALRQMAIRIARESENDYLPELEAVAGDEFGLLFEVPPRPTSLRTGEVLQTRFRYLGTVRAGELFYLFARLDPYEQSDLLEKSRTDVDANSVSSGPAPVPKVLTRVRRVSDPR